ncbi:hypothetical protein D3C87_1717730 [compost metagenome]
MHVEITRAVTGKIRRAILDDSFLPDETIFKGKAIDERLEGGARRAHGAAHLHETAPCSIEIISRTNFSQNITGLRVGHDDGD